MGRRYIPLRQHVDPCNLDTRWSMSWRISGYSPTGGPRRQEAVAPRRLGNAEGRPLPPAKILGEVSM